MTLDSPLAKRSEDGVAGIDAPRGKRYGFAVLAALLFSLAVGFVFQQSPLSPALTNRLLDWRVSQTPLPASGEIVFVAIDPASLREVGTWPWSRSVHADLLDRLVEAGAMDIFFDIDFAFASDPAGDRAFAQALERAGGATLLATFAQSNQIGPDADVVYNLPHPQFRDVSWPAAVNISNAPDGLIRWYSCGTRVDGQFVPSAASLLSSVFIEQGADFEINYGIDAASIPTYSAIDVLQGTVAAEDLDGRTIIIGAAALELGDHFAAPLHQVIPGALIHTIAAETLRQGVHITRMNVWPSVAALVIFLFGLSRLSAHKPWRLVGCVVLASVGIELVALIVFQASFAAISTGFLHPAMIAYAVARLAASVDLSRILLRRKDVDLANSEALLSHLFENSTDGVIILDGNGSELMQSQSAVEMFGLDETGNVKLPRTIQDAARNATQRIADGRPPKPDVGTVTFAGNDGARIVEFLVSPSGFKVDDETRDAFAETPIAAISARDVTELKKREREIAYLSTHDERTGALRRNTFLDHLAIRLSDDRDTAVFVVNLKGFKSVNVTFGRDIGDAVLSEVVERLQRCGKGLSAVARVGGDSFAVFLEVEAASDQIAELAEDVLECVSTTYSFESSNVQIGAHVGYYFVECPAPALASEALQRAEDALDVARTNARGGVVEYDPVATAKRDRVHAVERAMVGAIERGEFFVLYQPQHDLRDGSLIGAEALLRWRNPELGQVFPDEFIPIAESSGFILELGRFVLNQAAADALLLPDNTVMAVNVSATQLAEGDFLADVQTALKRTSLAPHRLCLELTETVMLVQEDNTVELIQDIAITGVSWAMDDFGTGFSSISYLSQLPLSKVKLDRSFVMNIDQDQTSLTILRSTKTLCDGLGLSLLCEGVETEHHATILRNEGIREAQGYLFGKPQTLDEILSALEYKHAASG